MKDMGRQRVTYYVARRFSCNSKNNSEIEKEIKKQESLTRVDEDSQQQQQRQDAEPSEASPQKPTVPASQKSPDAKTDASEKPDIKSFVTGGGIEVQLYSHSQGIKLNLNISLLNTVYEPSR
jgi:hypothetical protein